ncbi:MAG: response regulator, partial [bacterium]
VCEDDADILMFFKTIIRDTRFQLSPVLTGKEALEKAQREKIELAFIDVKLREEDGLDVLKRWKEIQPDTQIVMISAYSDSLMVRKAIQRGAFTYLFKPLKTMDVLSVTVKCLKKLGIGEVVSF